VLWTLPPTRLARPLKQCKAHFLHGPNHTSLQQKPLLVAKLKAATVAGNEEEGIVHEAYSEGVDQLRFDTAAAENKHM
jgi:hypothetical protein